MPDTARACSLSFNLSFNRHARLSSEPEAPPFELSVFLGKFVDLEELILADAGEILASIGRGPPNLQIQDLGILAEADMSSAYRPPPRLPFWMKRRPRK